MSYSNSHAATAYREREVMTATPAGLVVIVYDHVLANLRRAQAAGAVSNLEVRLEALSRARDGIMHLLMTLDVDKGGPMAVNLRALYGFIFTELMDEGRKRDPQRMDRLMHMVSELREAFSTVAVGTARVSAA
jgi:flagellar secretion chaperone FliS